MDKFNEIESHVATMKADADKFYNGGNAAAGTRYRKALQELKELAQAERQNVTGIKNK